LSVTVRGFIAIRWTALVMPALQIWREYVQNQRRRIGVDKA